MLNYTSEDYFLEEADSNIQQNLDDAVVQRAVASGVDLRQYSKEVEDELRQVENKSIQDYIKESGNIASLHNQIVECDGILERMEEMLVSFQSNLGSISHEILELQQQSVDMNMRLQNRQAVRQDLSQFVEKMVVPEFMITTILETNVTNAAFLEQIEGLEKKINFHKEQSFRDAKSCGDVHDIVEKLIAKSVSKIRQYFLERINAFKKPMTNYQIPQNSLLKFKFYNKFLMSNNREVAREIREEYVDVMSKVLFSYFKSYSGRLAKLRFQESAGREDMLAAFDPSDNLSNSSSSAAAIISSRGFFQTKPSLKNKASVFSLGDRCDVIGSLLETAIIVPHSQLKSDTKYPYEKLFRSEQYALLDNSCREFLFVVEFFMLSTNSAQDLFIQIFGKTLQHLTKQLELYVQDCYDCIGLLLCLHLVQKFQNISHRRAVSGTDNYWSTLGDILLNRIQKVIGYHTISVRDFDCSRLKSINNTVVALHPHCITRKYAEFSAAILSISQNGGALSLHLADETISRLMSVLQQEVENLILKMAANLTVPKDQLVFLINNYDVIVSTIGERTHSELSRESETFRQQYTSRSNEYIQHILHPYFGNLIAFVKESEVFIERNDTQTLTVSEWQIRMKMVVETFNAEWKRSLNSINGEILAAFPNFKNGTNILQQAITLLVQYYHRFLKIVSLSAFASNPARTHLINIHQLMVEVKKFKPVF